MCCAEHHPARKWVSKKLGLPGKAKDRVAVLTGIHPTPCTTPFGDYYMSLQVALSPLGLTATAWRIIARFGLSQQMQGGMLEALLVGASFCLGLSLGTYCHA